MTRLVSVQTVLIVMLLLAVATTACAAPAPTATPLPTPGAPAPSGMQPPPGFKPVVVRRGSTPTPVAGSRPPRTPKVKLKREYWLLEAPRSDAQRLEVGLLGAGPHWDAKEETDTWVRIDAGPFTGWAPIDVVEFVS